MNSPSPMPPAPEEAPMDFLFRHLNRLPDSEKWYGLTTIVVAIARKVPPAEFRDVVTLSIDEAERQMFRKRRCRRAA